MSITANPVNQARQRGYSPISIIFLMVILGFIALMVMRVGPMYLDFYSVYSTFQDISEEGGIAQMETFKIRDSLERRFDVNYVSIVRAKDVKIRRKDGGISLELKYEDRRPLLGNLEVVGTFETSVLLN